MDDQHTLDPTMAAHLANKGVGFPELATREFRAFHNGLRILMNLDVVELMQAGALPDAVAMDRFIKDPFRFFIRANDEKKAAIWRALQVRQPAELRAAEDDPPEIPLVAELLDATDMRRADNLSIAEALDRRAAIVLEPHL